MSSRLRVKEGGLHRGEARLIGEDGSKYDDRRFFTVEVDHDIPVAVIKARQHEIPYLDDAYYLERGAAARRGEGRGDASYDHNCRSTRRRALDQYKVLFCVNLPALNAGAAERLAAYISGGGRVVWICGDNVGRRRTTRWTSRPTVITAGAAG